MNKASTSEIEVHCNYGAEEIAAPVADGLESKGSGPERRMLDICTGVTRALLHAFFDKECAPVYERLMRDVACGQASVTLVPFNQLNAGISMSIAESYHLIREAIACNESWQEVELSEEYDSRWKHSVRMSAAIKIDPTDPMELGRPADVHLLYFLHAGMPRLRSCLITYSPEVGNSTPISLVCEEKR